MMDQITLIKKMSEAGGAAYTTFSTHLTIGLMLERGNLLDCHFLLPCRVPGLHHRTVGSLAQVLDRLVAGSNLTVGRIKLFLWINQ